MKFLRARGKNPTGGGLPEILLIMRLTMLFILLACLHVSAGGYAQGKISLTVKDASFEAAFKAILKQSSGYYFVGKPELLKSGKSVSLNLKDASLVEALNECFRGQSLTYEIQEKIIVVEALREQPMPMTANPINKGVSGQVADEDGGSIAGATVKVKGTKQIIAADSKGYFLLANIDPNAILVITCVGYETIEIQLNGKSIVNVKLKRKSGPLDEIHVIAYGSTIERYSTGNITTVTASDIEKQPVNNPLMALEGRVPGLFIIQGSGMPGSSMSVIVRGPNSITNGTNPFYVIDGVPYVSEVLPGTIDNGLLGSGAGADGSGLSNVNGNPLSYLNPSDIESIEVLKDADATAIYGSRAANGAILITTKKGKAGQMKVDINMQEGAGKIARQMKLLNTQQYLEMRHEAKINDGLTPGVTDYDINGTWDTTRYTDWQKALIGGTARYANLYVSVSGGNTNTQYMVGGTYNRSTTVFPGSFSDQKVSAHFNINSVSSNQKFHLQLTGSYLVDNNRLPGSDLTNKALTLPPDAPPLYGQGGSLNWALLSNGFASWTNPLASLNSKYNNVTNNLVGNAVVGYRILPGLEIKSSFGYTNMQTEESNLEPATSVQPIALLLEGGSVRRAQYAHNNIYSWIAEPQAVYNRNFGKGKLSALLGSTFEQNTSNGLVLSASGFNSDLVMNDILSAAVENVTSTVSAVYKYNAAFGRLSYNWDDKYLLNLNDRRDGSSRFGPANQFHDFASAGVGWIFSNELFVRKDIPFLSFGKIRGSYGTTGSDQIGDYRFLDLYSPTSVTVPYQGTTGLQINNLYNPNLAWELTKKCEGGVELGFFKDRLLLSGSYYVNHSSNQLISETLPSVTGFLSVESNLPALVKNSGLELVLNSININVNKFKWSSAFNVSIQRNKLVSISAEGGYTSFVGHSLGTTLLYHFLGVNDTTGIYQFSDSKGNPTSNPASMTIYKDLFPKYYGGFRNTFSYREFQLDVFFQFVNQAKSNYLFGAFPGSRNTNQPVWVLNRWQMPGDLTNIQRFSSNGSLNQQQSYAVNSDAGYADASFIRLKNISLSWELPNKWKIKAHNQNCRLYVQAENLLTFTSFKGMDPENGGTTSLPPLRTIAAGIQVSL